MKAKIREYIENRTKWIDITFQKDGENKNEHISEKIKLSNFETEFEHFYKLEKTMFNSTDELEVYIRFSDFEIIAKFHKINKLIIMGQVELKFPSLAKLKNLQRVYINQLSKPTKLENLSTVSNLVELNIGGFTFGKPIELISLNEVLKIKSLKKLSLGNIKLLNNDVKSLEKVGGLKELNLPNNLEVKDLAYLSAKMLKVKSNELQPYQNCISPSGDIKINGKRKPYLDKEKDSARVEKYVFEFEKMKKKFL